MKFNIPEEHKNQRGIYIIRSLISDDSLIGQTTNFKLRHYQYVNSFKRGKGQNRNLHKFVAEHGEENLSMSLLVIAPEINLSPLERYFIAVMKPTLNAERPKTNPAAAKRFYGHKVIFENGKYKQKVK